MGALDGIQEEIQRVAERVSNAVVGIGQRWGVGSGVVIAKDQVLTNAHNVRADEVTVTPRLVESWVMTSTETSPSLESRPAICQPLSGQPTGNRESAPPSSRYRIRVGEACASRSVS
jgi:hypothetical protein